MAETSDRDILANALLVIKHHGESAGYYAASRADELLDAGAIEGAKTRPRFQCIERATSDRAQRLPRIISTSRCPLMNVTSIER